MANSDSDIFNDYCYGISTDINGNICITGYFGASITFDTTTLINTGIIDLFVAKYD